MKLVCIPCWMSLEQKYVDCYVESSKITVLAPYSNSERSLDPKLPNEGEVIVIVDRDTHFVTDLPIKELLERVNAQDWGKS